MHSSSATFTNFSLGGVESQKINSSSPVVSSPRQSIVFSTPGAPVAPLQHAGDRPRSMARIQQEIAEQEDAAPRDFGSFVDRLAP